MSIARILKSPWTTHIGVGAIGAGVGIGVGYFLWGRKDEYEVVVPAEPEELDFDFDVDGIAEDISENRKVIIEEAYGKSLAEAAVSAPETKAEIINDMVIVRPDPVEAVEVNVFENQDPDWDWEKEVENRNEEGTYILHKDEFYRNERDYTQTSLTWYEGDDIMIDEEDVPVYGYETITGPLRFGHGSGDPDVVLVRNVPRKAEFEISHERGRYEVEILGLHYEEKEASQDLKHSRVSKFRMD